MSFSVIGSAAGKGTTSAIDTTGANLLIAALSGDIGAISDSKGNTWTALNSYLNGSSQGSKLYYCYGATVGSGHTVTDSVSYAAVQLLAVSGASSAPFDVQNGYVAPSLQSTIQPGSVIPSQNDSLIVSAVNHGSNSTVSSINSGFTIDAGIPGISGTQWGGSIAHLIQTIATSANPTWTIDNATAWATSIAVFKPAAGGTTLTGSNSDQANTSTSGSISQTHIVTGSNSTQANSSTTAGIVQENILTGANCIQANTSSADSIAQTHILTGANAEQSNTSSSAGIAQTQVLSGADSTQTNTSSTGSISTDGTVFLSGASSTQNNTSSAGDIGQTNVLAGGDCSQANTCTSAGIGQVHLLSGADSTQTNTSSIGAIIADGTVNLSGANATQTNISGTAAISQTYILTGANCTQINTSRIADNVAIRRMVTFVARLNRKAVFTQTLNRRAVFIARLSGREA